MSHTSDIESSANPDGLQEIRSWASRSPGSARPSFRSRRPSGNLSRSSSRLALFLLLVLPLLLLSLAGYRFFQSGRGSSDLATVPEPRQIAQAGEENNTVPPVAEAVVDIPQARTEPVQAHAQVRATRPVQAIPTEQPRKEATVARPKPTPREPKAVSSQVVVSRDAFESEPAVLLSAPAAEYPDAARETGTTAEIVVGFTIDETGAVRDPAVESSRVQGSAPEALFVEAALAATRRARFVPARERGVPTRSWSTLTFSFEAGPAHAGIQATHPPDRSRTGSTR